MSPGVSGKPNVSYAGFDPSFKRPICLATLKSCDTTKQSVCGWLYIYIYISESQLWSYSNYCMDALLEPIDENYTRMLRTVLNKSWKQYVIKKSSCTATYLLFHKKKKKKKKTNKNLTKKYNKMERPKFVRSKNGSKVKTQLRKILICYPTFSTNSQIPLTITCIFILI